MRGRTEMLVGSAFLLLLGGMEDGSMAVSGRETAIATEIARLQAYVDGNDATDETWSQIRQGSEPTLVRAREAAEAGYAWLALYRLAAVYGNLEAYAYTQRFTPAQLADSAAFLDAWSRTQAELRDGLDAPRPEAMAGIGPAVVRACGEAALPQTRIYFDASPAFARETDPASGFIYLGLARAQQGLVDFCRGIGRSSAQSEPPLRSLDADIDGLEDEVLRAYRPPASIERHSEFIVVGSSLKEARELQALGLQRGALLRYLLAALRFAPIRADAARREDGTGQEPMSLTDLASQLTVWEERLSSAGTDHTIGQLFTQLARFEQVRADTAGTPSLPAPALAAGVVTDVLPRYMTALGPAPSAAPTREPRVTVTLVRWPYT